MRARSSFAETHHTRRVGSQPPFDSVLSETHCWQQQFSFGFFRESKFFFLHIAKTSVLRTKLVLLNNFVCWTLLWRHFDFPQGKLSFRIYANFFVKSSRLKGLKRRVVLTEIRVLTAMSSQENLFSENFVNVFRNFRSIMISQYNFISKPKALVKWTIASTMWNFKSYLSPHFTWKHFWWC